LGGGGVSRSGAFGASVIRTLTACVCLTAGTVDRKFRPFAVNRCTAADRKMATNRVWSLIMDFMGGATCIKFNQPGGRTIKIHGAFGKTPVIP